jgi:8-oxo-dGTP diphosphatase
MGKMHILVFIIAIIIVIYVINRRIQQKEKEKHLNDENKKIDMLYTYAYPRPSVTVDIIVTKKENNSDYILLIERKNEPFKNQWALPGGFIDINEDIINAAYRELKEETSISDIKLQQLHTFGKPGRDPRGRTISVIYTGELLNLDQKVEAGDDAKIFRWFKLKEIPDMAFDHKDIVKYFMNNRK